MRTQFETNNKVDNMMKKNHILIILLLAGMAYAGDNDTVIEINNASFSIPNNLTILNYTINVSGNTTTLNSTYNATLQDFTMILIESDWLTTLLTTTTELITDNGAMVIGTILTIWLFLWKRNRLLAGTGIMMTGLSMELTSAELAGTFGWIMFGAGMLTIIYEINSARKKMKTI